MFCNKCGAQLPESSAFCNKCGASQSAAPPPGPPGPPSPGSPPLLLPIAGPTGDGAEENVWSGRYSAKAVGHWWLLWFLGVVGLLSVYFILVPADYRKPIVLYVLLGLIGLPLLAILWHVFVRKISLRYRLSTHRFFIERGIISRHINELELIRVDDVSVRQNIIQRIFNVGVVTIISTDATDPKLAIEGIDNPIEVKEKIRTHAQQRRKRAVHLESL